MEKVPFQMNDQVSSGPHLFTVITFLTENKRDCDSSRSHKGPAVWLFSEFMTGTALASITALQNLSPDDVNQHEGLATSYAGVFVYLLRT